MTLTVGSLFSGIGGLDLGLERAGMNVIWQSEIDPYACKVLAKHWKDIPNHGNIKEIEWGDVVRPDVICGGYPCQPFSTAGKRNGTDDPRHLWPWVREAISVLRPRYAILENVRGHVSLGLDIVLREMASIGYDAEWQIVSAASVGAPHRRDRVIIVAYPCEQFKHGRGHLDSQSATRQGQALQEQANKSNSIGTDPIRELADSNNSRCVHRQSQIFTTDRWLNALSHIGSGSTDVANTDGERRQKSLCKGARVFAGNNVGRSGVERRQSDGWWETEPNVGRVANGVPARLDRLRGLGNAVVPQVAELVGRMVIDYDNQ